MEEKFELNEDGLMLLLKLEQLFDLQEYFGLKVDYDGDCNEKYGIADYLRQSIIEIGQIFSKEEFMSEFDDVEIMWNDMQPYLRKV
jgi:hypothetical protein